MTSPYTTDPALAHLHPQSIAEEGFIWFHGNGVTRNLGKAFSAWEKAAASDNAAALYGLGMLYEHGLGVTRDALRALDHFERAASQGHLTAQIGARRVQRQLGEKVVAVGTEVARSKIADFREPPALHPRISLALILVGLGFCFSSAIFWVPGISLIAFVVYLFVSNRAFRISLTDGQIVRQTLFGQTQVTLGPDTRYRYRGVGSIVDGVPAGQLPVSVQQGTSAITFDTRLLGIEKLRLLLLSMEKLDCLPHARKVYTDGRLLEFDLLKLQRGTLLFEDIALALEDVVSIKLEDGRIIIHGRNSQHPFVRMPIARVANLYTLLQLLKSHTNAGIATGN